VSQQHAPNKQQTSMQDAAKQAAQISNIHTVRLHSIDKLKIGGSSFSGLAGPMQYAIDGSISANIRNWAMPPVGQFPSLDQRTMFVK